MTPQDHAEAVAKSAAHKLGQSFLGIALAGVIARWDICFLTYAQLQELVTMPSGRHPHVESVGRKVREMRDQQLLSHRRVMPGAIPRRAKRRAWNGTTENSLVWATLRERTPLSRAERRRARIEHERSLGAIEREKRRLERDAEVAFFKRLSGDVTPLPEPTYRQAIDSLVAKAVRAGDRNERRRARATGGGAGPVLAPSSVATGPPE